MDNIQLPHLSGINSCISWLLWFCVKLLLVPFCKKKYSVIISAVFNFKVFAILICGILVFLCKFGKKELNED